jgi:hypothetical protein
MAIYHDCLQLFDNNGCQTGGFGNFRTFCRQNWPPLSPSVVLTVGAMMTFVSLLFSPETKDLELSAVGEDQASPASLGFGEVPIGKP